MSGSFYSAFAFYCKKEGKAPSVVAREIGIDPTSCSYWRKGVKPRNDTLKKIADYFGVALEELLEESTSGECGLESQDFWINFVRQCEKIEKSPSIVVEELGFKRSAVTSWKNGALPRVKSRKRIADYFGITVEELMATQRKFSFKGRLSYEWADLEEAFKNATPEMREAAKAAALAVLQCKKK